MDQAVEIVAARTRLKMSQEMLALAAEVSVRTVIRAEQGTRISGESLRALCAVLGLDSAALNAPSPGASPTMTSDASMPEGSSASADVGPAVETGRNPGKDVLKRVLGFRRTPVAIAAAGAFFVAFAVPAACAIYAIGKEAKADRWNGEQVFAIGTAKYMNALASGKASASSSPSYEFVGCANRTTFTAILGSILQGDSECRRTFRTVRVERKEAIDGSTLLAVGPVSAEFGHHVARRLSGDPALSWSVAYGTGRQGQELAWFDPRRVPAEEFPGPPGGDGSWVFVRLVHRTEGRS